MTFDEDDCYAMRERRRESGPIIIQLISNDADGWANIIKCFPATDAYGYLARDELHLSVLRIP
jgi:hypothetical protein